MTYTYIEKDFEIIKAMVHRGWAETIGIDWMRTIISWSWVYYYKYKI